MAIWVVGWGPTQTVEGQTWTGAVDSNWLNPANWSSDSVPGDTIGFYPTIPGPNGPIINGTNVTAADVTITYSGTDLPTILSITNNGSFTTLGGLVVLGGEVLVSNGTMNTTVHNQDNNDIAYPAQVVVTGPNSVWSSGDLDVGGTLQILDAATVNSIGIPPNGGISVGGNVVVDGSGTTWNVQALSVGYGLYQTGNATLTISNGGQVLDTFAGDTHTGIANGTVVVTGPNSAWINAGGVGYTDAQLLITNGGYVSEAAGTLYNVAYSPPSGFSPANITVSGSNSTLNNSGDMELDYGNITAVGGGTLVIGGNLNLGTSSNAELNVASGGTVQINGAKGIVDESLTFNQSSSSIVNFNGGTLVVGANQTATGNATFATGTTSIINTNDFIENWSGNFSGGGNLEVAGNGTVALTGNNTSLGDVMFTGNGTLSLSGNNTSLGEVVLTGNETLALSGNNTSTGGIMLNEGTLELEAGASLSAGTITLGGGKLQWVSSSVDPSTVALLFTSPTTTLDTNGNNVILANAVGDGGNGGLLKIGGGTLTLAAATTYTGNTDVRTGGLTLSFSGSQSPASNIINSTSQLILEGGATLTLTGNAGASNVQTFNGTQITGSTEIDVFQNGAASLNVNLGTVTRSASALVNFFLPSSGNVTLSGGNSVGGLLTDAQGTAYATAGGWAAYSNGIVSVLTNYQTDPNPADWQRTDNVSLSNSTLTVAANTTINSLLITGNSHPTAVAIQNGSILTLQTGGLIASGFGGYTISGGTLTSATPELVVEGGQGGLQISSQIADGGRSMALTVGAGNLTLNGTNTYSGGTYLSGGCLTFSPGSLGNGPVTLNGGNLAWAANNNTDVSARGLKIGTAGGTLIPNSNTITLASNISGSGNLTVTRDGTFILSGNNANPTTGFSGNLVFNDFYGVSVVQFSNLSNLGSGNIVFEGGTLQWASGTSTDVTVKNIITTDVNSAGANFDTNGNNVTFAHAISGSGGIGKVGAGTLTLTAAETFTYNVGIYGGTLQVGDGNTNAQFSNTTNITDSASLAFTANSTGETFGGVISGNGSVVVNGTGNVTFTGANTYTGGTTVVGDTLSLSGTAGGNITNNGNVILAVGGNYFGVISGTGNVTIAAATTFTSAQTYTGNTVLNNNLSLNLSSASQTFAGVISGTGVLTLNSTGNVTFSAANTLTGNINIPNINLGFSNTRLILANPLAMQGSTLNITAGNLAFSGITNATLGGLSGNRNIALTNLSGSPVALTVGENNSNLNTTYSAVFSDGGLGGSLTKIDASALTLTGTNTYTGGTFIDGGNLTFSNLANLGTGNLTFNGGTLVWASSTLTDISSRNVTIGAGGGTLLVNSGNVTLANPIGDGGTGGLTKSGSGTLILLGNETYTGNTTIAAGKILLGNPTALQNSTVIDNLNSVNLNFGSLTNATLGGLSGNNFQTNIALTNNASTGVALILGGNNQNLTFDGHLSGLGSLTKTGNGILTLNGINGFSGNMLIDTGTLAGSGEIGSNYATINGTLQSGSINSPESISFGGNLTLTPNATVDMTYGGFGSINVGGNLSLNGTLILSLANPSWGELSSVLGLFQATDIAGAFSTMDLPTLGTDLTWDTSLLDTTGDISVYANNFPDWAGAVGLSGNDALPNAEPFGGSPANVLRYAMNLGTAPTPASAPVVSQTNINNLNYLTLQYQARKDITDYQLIPQSSTDLVNWTNVDAGNITQLTDVDAYTAQYQAAVVMPASGTVFLRVVAQPMP